MIINSYLYIIAKKYKCMHVDTFNIYRWINVEYSITNIEKIYRNIRPN